MEQVEEEQTDCFADGDRQGKSDTSPQATHADAREQLGTARLYMHFNVSGPLGEGVAQLHMIRLHDESEYHYGYLAVDVPGHPRIYVENADAERKKRTTPGTFLGIRWT